MYRELTVKELSQVNGGDLEDLGYALTLALGAAGTVVAVASIPFTGAAGVGGAFVAAGAASYAWGCLTD